jgi:hypothetical protein
MASQRQDQSQRIAGGFPTPSLGLLSVLAALVALCLGAGCSDDAPPDAAATDAEREQWAIWSESEEQWRLMEAGEDLIIQLTPDVARLEEAVSNFQLPHTGTRSLFGSEVAYRDLADAPATLQDAFPGIGAKRESWPIGSDARAASADLQLWNPLFDDLQYFTHTAFKIKLGQFVDAAGNEFAGELHFDGGARTRSGRVLSIHGVQDVVWRNLMPEQSGEEADWRIVEWSTRRFEVLDASAPLFEEVLGSVLTKPRELARARDSIHERLIVEFVLDQENFEVPHLHFTAPSEDFHPGIAVVDLDRDGFDDFYVMERWGANMFFRNRGDGSFEEVAAELGLDIVDHSSSAIFADFDNDGDLDLLLGRTLERSQYLVNEDGRFVDRSESHVDDPLPYFASSASAADYDGDGLLDIYISTYQGVMLKRELARKGGIPREGLLSEYLPQIDAQRLGKLRAADDFHRFINQPGPPNVLLHNLGGRFDVVHDAAALRIFRNSYQATWGDFDQDGDPDVYVANDFAPNNMIRNDGGGRFTDITAETETADIGFGMGVAWGDYDNDGRSDLYVSNMYSSAGNRILRKLDHVDDTFLGAAQGNTLFRNTADRFDKVSGLDAPALQVEKAGWSWGGQFVDFDNDGFQDIYALSGYYSAPKKVAIERDT